jgi:hypothetical protein
MDVYVETSPKRVFVCAYEWPGYVRAGRDEADGMDALAAYAPRYAPIAKAAGLSLEINSAADLHVVEHLAGDGTTAFGAPSRIPDRDRQEPSTQEKDRLLSLLSAAWEAFDKVVANSPEELRKGPRGGGRDRSKIVAHVLAAEAGYSRLLGAKMSEPAPFDSRVIAAHRLAMVEALRRADEIVRREPDHRRWPMRYAVRRVAWHTLDHTWEIEDRRT